MGIVCSLTTLLQDNDALPALRFVPSGMALAVDTQNAFAPSVSEIGASLIPCPTGSAGSEEVRMYNWRAEEGWLGSNGPDLDSSYF